MSNSTRSYSSHSKSYTTNNILEYYKRRKHIFDRRKTSWENLFHKYSQPVTNEPEINLETLMPEECNILENNISKDKISTHIHLENTEKEKKNITHERDISETCYTRVIWSISSTSLLMVQLNVGSSKTIIVKKQYMEDTNFVLKNIKPKGSKKFCIQTQAFDSDSD